MRTHGLRVCSASGALWDSICKLCRAHMFSRLTTLPSGNIELTAVFPFLGNTEIQIVSALSAFLLLATQGATAASVREKVLLSSS